MKYKSKKGFTLIELIIVVAILAVIAAIAIPSVAGLIDRANKSSDKTNAKEMTNAIERFVSEYQLAKQDIYAGMFIPGDMNSAQGRVHSSVGIQTINDIAALEKDSYGFSTLAISRKTKYPINEKTVKQIILNYCKTSSSVFQPKQTDMAYYYSPELGVVIVAPIGSAKDKLMDIAIAEGSQSIEYTEWINLTINANKEEAQWNSKVWATETPNEYIELQKIADTNPKPDVEFDNNKHHSSTNGNTNTGSNSSGGGNGGSGGGNQGGNTGGTPPCSHTSTLLKDVKQPTCTENGFSGDVYCSTCNEVVEAGVTLPKLGHLNTRVEGATPTFSGNVYCEACNVKISDGKPIGHEGGIIPVGATYKSNCLNYCAGCFSILTVPSTNAATAYCGQCGAPSPNINYWNQGVTYAEGQEFPTARPGDIYTFGDYTYMYECEYNYDHYWSYTNEGGWGARVVDVDKSSYDPALVMINSNYTTSMSGTYSQCDNLESLPELPYTTVNVSGAFMGCRALKTVDKNFLKNLTFLKDISYIFNGCSSLQNTVHSALIIPDSIEEYTDALRDVNNDLFITGTNNNTSNEVLSTLITQDRNVVLTIPKNNIYLEYDKHDHADSFTASELLSSSMENYSFTPTVDGNYLFYGAYGYDGSYWYLETYSNYRLCDCYTSIYDWCPDYYDCDHDYLELELSNELNSYDSFGALVDVDNGSMVASNDDGYTGYLYYRSDSNTPTIEDFGVSCPYHDRDELHKSETCTICKKSRYYNCYCYIYNDGSEYNFGYYASLKADNEYLAYILPLYKSYTGVYDDFILIRYQD